MISDRIIDGVPYVSSEDMEAAMISHRRKLEEALQVARAALADIGYSEDMPIAFAKAKARRVYEQTAVEEGEQ